MRSPTPRPARLAPALGARAGVLALVLALVLLVTACTSDSTGVGGSTTTAARAGTTAAPATTTTSTTAPPSTTSPAGPEAVQFDKAIQGELAAVGCYSGGIDGIIGPETDAAILAFQRAAGLDADGELGPETRQALADAAAGRRQVCVGPDGTTVPGGSSTTTPAGGPPSCTATALLAAMEPGDTLQGYACADDYAGVYVMRSDRSEGRAVLRADGNVWTNLGARHCGGASAGIPPVVLDIGCGT